MKSFELSCLALMLLFAVVISVDVSDSVSLNVPRTADGGQGRKLRRLRLKRGESGVESIGAPSDGRYLQADCPFELTVRLCSYTSSGGSVLDCKTDEFENGFESLVQMGDCDGVIDLCFSYRISGGPTVFENLTADPPLVSTLGFGPVSNVSDVSDQITTSFPWPQTGDVLNAPTRTFGLSIQNTCICQSEPNQFIAVLPLDQGPRVCVESLSFELNATSPPTCSLNVSDGPTNIQCEQESTGDIVDCNEIGQPTSESDCNVTVRGSYNFTATTGPVSINDAAIFECCDGQECQTVEVLPTNFSLTDYTVDFECQIDICRGENEFNITGVLALDNAKPTCAGIQTEKCSETIFESFKTACIPLMEMAFVSCVTAADSSVDCSSIPPATSKDQCDTDVLVTYKFINLDPLAALNQLSSEMCFATQTDCFPVITTDASEVNSDGDVTVMHTINVCNEQDYNINAFALFDVGARDPNECGVNITTQAINATPLGCQLDINVMTCSFVTDSRVYDCENVSDPLKTGDCFGDFEYTVVVTNAGVSDLVIQSSEVEVTTGSAMISPELSGNISCDDSETYTVLAVDVCVCDGVSESLNFSLDTILGQDGTCYASSTFSTSILEPICSIMLSTGTSGFMCNQSGTVYSCDEVPTPTSEEECVISVSNTFALSNSGNSDANINSIDFVCCEDGDCQSAATNNPQTTITPMTSEDISFNCNINICDGPNKYSFNASAMVQSSANCSTNGGEKCSDMDSESFEFECLPLTEVILDSCKRKDDSLDCSDIPPSMSEDECRVEVLLAYTLANAPENADFVSFTSSLCYDGQPEECMPISSTSPPTEVTHTLDICSAVAHEYVAEYTVDLGEIHPTTCSKNLTGTIPLPDLKCDLNISITDCSFVSDGQTYDCENGLQGAADQLNCEGTFEYTVLVRNEGATDVNVESSLIVVNPGSATSSPSFPIMGTTISPSTATIYVISVADAFICDDSDDSIVITIDGTIVESGNSCNAMASLTTVGVGSRCLLEFIGPFPRIFSFAKCLFFQFAGEVYILLLSLAPNLPIGGSGCVLEFFGPLPRIISFVFCLVRRFVFPLF